jgi:lysozyme
MSRLLKVTLRRIILSVFRFDVRYSDRVFAVLFRAFPAVLALEALLSHAYAFPNLSGIDAVRSELQLGSSREKALSEAEREPFGIIVIPGLIYDIINLSDADSNTDVEEWLSYEGLDAVIHRSSMGTDGSDKEYNNRAAAAVHASYKWGAYHFLRPNGSGQDQATWFIKTLIKSSDHPKAVLLIIDVEYLKGANPDHPTLTQIIDCVKRIHELTGTYPGVYTGQDFLREQFNTVQYGSSTLDLFEHTWLWMACYSPSYNTLTFPVVHLPPWDRWSIWQISDEENPPPMREGMKAEMNVFKILLGHDLERFWNDHSWDYKLQTALD